jgi:tetrahydromethanopterin S-methyltransferase subunit B
LNEAIQAVCPRRHDIRHSRDEDLKKSSEASESGINSLKPGKPRLKPLPPIIVEDPNDTVAMKRARNTLAARKSRQRKIQRFEELEDKITKLEAKRDHWENIALQRTSRQSKPLLCSTSEATCRVWSEKTLGFDR